MLFMIIVDWLAACSDMDALSNMPKWETVMNQWKNLIYDG